jgi:hypothetical protein
MAMNGSKVSLQASLAALLCAACASTTASRPAPAANTTPEPKGCSALVEEHAPVEAILRTCASEADAGSSIAQLNVGLILRDHPEIRDHGQPEDWFRRSAQGGHPASQYVMAVANLKSGDRAEALRLLQSSFCAGFPPALESGKEAGLRAESCGDPNARYPLDGLWEGSLRVQPRDPPDPLDTFELRVEIRGETARVFGREKDGWREVKPGKFSVHRHKASAVLQAIDDGWDDNNWVETWSLNITLADVSRLRVTYARMVNNLQSRRTERDATWTRTAYGDLRPVPAQR